MSRFPRPWWVAGGWAVDLFLGYQSRGHDDLDIEILRRHQFELRRALDGWDLRAAISGRLLTWPPGPPVPAEANSLWCRQGESQAWQLQVLLAQSDGDRWLFRRHPATSRRVDEVGALSSDGIPYLVPEVALLFKAKGTRPKDEEDFAAALPRMDLNARRWLSRALEAVHPGHRWIDELRSFRP